ncbi:MAG TPA: aminotransferase class I/II-fold pyridoxal phosphate-dependent enzyme [Verrucomicrobiae bacterium]
MDQSRYIARHVINLPKSGIRDFFEIVSKMKDVISLGIGEPDFDTPWHIREAGIYALEKGKTHYTSNLGLIELRRAISKYVGKNFAVSYAPENEIIITVGVSEALDIACRAFINPGDKVMFHQPCYVSYSPSSRSRMALLCRCQRSRRIILRSPWTRSAPRGSRAAKCSC